MGLYYIIPNSLQIGKNTQHRWKGDTSDIRGKGISLWNVTTRDRRVFNWDLILLFKKISVGDKGTYRSSTCQFHHRSDGNRSNKYGPQANLILENDEVACTYPSTIKNKQTFSNEQRPKPTHLGADRTVVGEGVLERALVGAPGEVANMDAVLRPRAVLPVGIPPRCRHRTLP